MGTTQERYNAVVEYLINRHKIMEEYIGATETDRTAMFQDPTKSAFLSELGLNNGNRAFSDEALKRTRNILEHTLESAGVKVQERAYVLPEQSQGIGDTQSEPTARLANLTGGISGG